jgi:tetratricopeptide (TPR) repeat protein
LGRYDRAEADCTEAIAVLGGKSPELNLDPLVIEQQAQNALRDGKWGPWFFRGLARQDSGRYQQAAEDYTSVLKANPRHLWALCNRGTCRRMLGAYDAAMKDFDAALNGGLNDWRPWAGEGWIEAHRGRWDRASLDYTEAIRRHPEPAYVWRDAALVRLRLEDNTGYQALCAALVKRTAGSDLGTRLQTALTCAVGRDAVSDWSELQRWCEEGKSKKSSYTELVQGAVLYRQGRFEEARGPLQEAAGGPRGVLPAAARLLLAMAWQRDAKEKEAARELADGVRAVQTAGDRLVWEDRLLLELLRAEAEALCRPKKTDPGDDKPRD